jgi:hypothetical protein
MSDFKYEFETKGKRFYWNRASDDAREHKSPEEQFDEWLKDCQREGWGVFQVLLYDPAQSQLYARALFRREIAQKPPLGARLSALVEDVSREVVRDVNGESFARVTVTLKDTTLFERPSVEVGHRLNKIARKLAKLDNLPVRVSFR